MELESLKKKSFKLKRHFNIASLTLSISLTHLSLSLTLYF